MLEAVNRNALAASTVPSPARKRCTRQSGKPSGLEQAKGSLAGMKSGALVSKARVVEKKAPSVDDELKQLERKDEEDKEIAIAGCEKAAKKLKKKKGKKK